MFERRESMGAEIYPQLGSDLAGISGLTRRPLYGEVTESFQVRAWEISKPSQMEKMGEDTVGQSKSEYKGTKL